MKPLKVFIVDDDPDFAEGVAITLEIEGHEVAFASTGEEAVRKFREQDFDVTLMDVRMPGMNGVESFMELRKIKPDAKVIMMTAYSVEDLMRQAVKEGALGVLHKPIDSDVLLKAVVDAKPAGLILVADDDSDFTEGLQLTLTKEGYSVCVARNGQEAVDKVLDKDFDVLLLDIRLPVLSGLDVYAELKERGRALPTLIVTGYVAEESESIAALLRMSAKGCLVKPFATADLLTAVEALV
ncbi:MAG: response regulator [Rhodospirillales bacterium]|nr:response regulator [Rhodospirillales bacterium]